MNMKVTYKNFNSIGIMYIKDCFENSNITNTMDALKL